MKGGIRSQKNSVDKNCWGCKWHDTTFVKGCTNPYFCTNHNKYKQAFYK